MAARSFGSSVGSGIAGAGFLPVTVSWGKTICRERDPGKHLTGVLPCSGTVAAFLAGQAVIQHRHHQLCVTLQANDGELSQAYIQAATFSADHQLLVEHLQDALGNLRYIAVLALAYLPHPGRKHHRIQHLYYSGRKVGGEGSQAVRVIESGSAGEDLGCAFLAAQHCPFGEYGQAAQGRRPAAPNHRVCQNTVIEGHINAVVIGIESHRLHCRLLRYESRSQLHSILYETFFHSLLTLGT